MPKGIKTLPQSNNPIDYNETMEALRRIGYDTTQNINLQFKDKIRRIYGVSLDDMDTDIKSKK